ncbi:MAG: electron transport complex subunit RsxC [Sterolibacterium sp.]|nr:electron transport complex subunit RsxC [Sterolibacterium sp.]MBP9800191.1 electron transport complex subunit RsxC [Sterolibacterium sp.]
MIARLFRFNGGVKPDYHKEESTSLPIATAPLPRELVIPLHQSVGGTPRPLVAAGDRVLKGQRIGAADGHHSPAVHASTSGTVLAVDMRRMTHPSGLSALCVILAPDLDDRWIERQPFDYRNARPEAIRDYLRDAGIVGLGGAVFPSHLKMNPGRQGKLDTLVINGAECEPYITCDDLQMRERAPAIIAGVSLMREILDAGQALIGIEDNKPEAIAAMNAALQQHGDRHLRIIAIPTRYPAGGAKQLIRVLTGIEVPHGKRSTDYGVQCFNTGTAHAIHDALLLGQPLVSRIVTVAGNVATPRNFEVALGTPMRDLLALCQPKADTDRLIMGGPMMGVTLPGDEVPVVKATNCLLAGSPALFPPPAPEMPCIRCGECAKVCPADLQPFEMYWYAKAKLFGKAQEYHLFDCIECGCCAYVCPSRIPLVDYYRFAKSEIWARERDKTAADEARERYEFRLARDEREKQEKAAKLAAKAAATREKLAQQDALATADGNPAPEDDPKKALIAAALARAQQQKHQTSPKNTDDLATEQQTQIAEIEARRAQLREMAQTGTAQED